MAVPLSENQLKIPYYLEFAHVDMEYYHFQEIALLVSYRHVGIPIDL